MTINTQAELFPTIIPLITRVKAEQFRRYQSQGKKAKQVYLNTLAVSTVNAYLNSIGWSTDLEDSDSWNPVLQTIMDVADLQIPGYGKLECRVVLADEERVIIPPEVWSGRIGYVVVRLDKSLTQATVLGFVSQVNQVELPISELKSLSQFPAYLSQQEPKVAVQPTSFSDWFSGMWDSDWHQPQEVLTPNLAINFRSPKTSDNLTANQVSSAVSGVKLVELLGKEEQAIALVLDIQPQSFVEYNISIMVCNPEKDDYLPEGLELVILDEANRPVMVAQANKTKTIEFCFSGKRQESFSIEMSLDEQTKLESFVI